MNGWGEGLEKNTTKNLTMALRLFKVGTSPMHAEQRERARESERERERERECVRVCVCVCVCV
jgi:hypothetical protein